MPSPIGVGGLLLGGSPVPLLARELALPRPLPLEVPEELPGGDAVADDDAWGPLLSDADTVCTAADLADLWDSWYATAEKELATVCHCEPIQSYLGRGAYTKVKMTTIKIFKGQTTP